MVSHDQKSYVAPHFDHLNFMNAMMLLLMSSVLHGTKTGTNGNTVFIFKQSSSQPPHHILAKSHFYLECCDIQDRDFPAKK